MSRHEDNVRQSILSVAGLVAALVMAALFVWTVTR